MQLTIKGLDKTYGTNHALNHFTYDFTQGVYGLLGPNGAGKSTLMNIITDNLKQDEGTISVGDKEVTELGKEYRKLLGYMPQQQGVYTGFTLGRFLYYIASLKGIPKAKAREEIEWILPLVNLSDCMDKRLGAFSGGMKQRALIAQAMLGSPKILILDEPTAGLDPKERIRIRNMIAEIAFEKIVILATHVVSDIEFIAKEILLLKKGVLIDSGNPLDMCNKIEDKTYNILTQMDEIDAISKKYKVCNISKENDGIVVRVLSDCGIDGYKYERVKPTLEDVYLHSFDD